MFDLKSKFKDFPDNPMTDGSFSTMVNGGKTENLDEVVEDNPNTRVSPNPNTKNLQKKPK